MNSYILLRCIASERCLSEHVIGDPGNGSKTGILNSIVFHRILTVEFDFASEYVTIGDVFIVTSVTVFDVRLATCGGPKGEKAILQEFLLHSYSIRTPLVLLWKRGTSGVRPE